MSAPKVVVTIHGIRTRGEWQKKITPHLAAHGLVPYHIDYGWFGALRFFLPWTRDRQLQSTRDELRNLIDKVRARRVSVIAHSFGTFLAIESLRQENGNLRFDRVVLTGCILARDFDWAEVINTKKLAMVVRNERATVDLVVVLARIASSRWLRWLSRLRVGDSGRNPFAQQLPELLDYNVVGNHSETHNPLKFEQWARFIAYPYLPDDVLERLIPEMQALRQEVAVILARTAAQAEPELVRISLFAPIHGALRIVPGATDNMLYAPEFTLEILENHGAIGTAFSSGNPCVMVKQGKNWSGNSLPGAELEKLSPSLKWVIALPIKSAALGSVLGVISVDGLDKVPDALHDSSKDDYKAAVLALFATTLPRFGPSLDNAFRGDQLPQLGS